MYRTSKLNLLPFHLRPTFQKGTFGARKQYGHFYVQPEATGPASSPASAITPRAFTLQRKQASTLARPAPTETLHGHGTSSLKDADLPDWTPEMKNLQTTSSAKEAEPPLPNLRQTHKHIARTRHQRILTRREAKHRPSLVTHGLVSKQNSCPFLLHLQLLRCLFCRRPENKTPKRLFWAVVTFVVFMGPPIALRGPEHWWG
jgi:hypothetical protein